MCKPISLAAKYSVLLPSYRGTLAKTVSKHLGMLVLRDSAEVPRGQLSVRNTQTCVNTLGSRMAARNGQRQKKQKQSKQTQSWSTFQSGALVPNCWKDADSVVTKLSPAFNEGCWRFREEQACIMGVYFWQLSCWQLMTELMVFLLFIGLSVLIRGFRYKTAVTERPRSWKYELACCGYSRFPPNAKEEYF